MIWCRFVATLLFLCVSVSAVAEDFVSLRKEALRLRNTDSHVRQEKQWRDIAFRLVEFSSVSNSPSEAGQALFSAARMYRTMYEEKRDKEDIDRAKELLDRLVERFSTAQLAPQALKELSEISERYYDDEDESRGYLKDIVKKYPDSEYYDFAYAALYGERRTSEKQPSDAISVRRTGGPTIVLDPGHGGEDLGAVGVSGLLEKDVVLDVAFLTEQELQRRLGANVVLTRRKDEFVPLQRRTEIANEAGADVFISLHTNASEAKTLRGFEIYVLDNTSDSASIALADRENASGGDVDDIAFMISDLIQSSKTPESIDLANHVQRAVEKTLQRSWKDIRILKAKKAPFYVLVGAHMPAVLAELFFIDETSDGGRLAEAQFRKDLAVSLSEGISNYLKR